MKRTIFAVACAGLLAAQVVQADLEKGAYAPDIQAKEWLNTENGEAVSLADYRGMVVVLFFWVSFHEGGKGIMTTINLVENHPNLGKARGLVVIGLTDSDMKRTKPVIESEKVTFAVGVESKSHEDYRISNYPRIVVIDTEGKVAWTGWPGNENEMSRAVLDALAATPPTRSHPDKAKAALKSLEAARTAVRAQKYREAFEAARDAYENALTGDPLKTRCQDMLDLLEAIGRDRLAIADQAADDAKFDEAVKGMRAVMREFRGLEAAKSAKSRLDALGKANPQVAEILKSQQGSAKARGDLKKAQDAVDRKDYGPAYELLEGVAKEFEGTEEGDKAAAALEKAHKNERIMAEVRDYKADRDCKRWMSEARALIGSRRNEEAKKKLTMVLEKYPDTSFAKDAARELAKLP